MFQAAFRAMSQVFEPPFRSIFWKMLGYTLGILIVIWIALQSVVGYLLGLAATEYGDGSSWISWAEWSVSILTGIGAVFVLGFLIAPISALLAGLFQDEIADILETRDYPADRPGTALPLSQSIVQTIKFTGVVILGNLLALVLLLVPGVNLIAFFLVNGYLLGREFFEFAAMRFLPPAEAKAFRRARGGTVFLGGLVIACLLAVPVLNLVTPIFATIFMIHVYKKLASAAAI
ncbi:sulfate transporter family protein [Roseibium aggregatum]|uniref:Sulfate transporter family protein n=1 Tax=Roseibium aggregatum TaxID=187304 RepID=A0A939J3T0_9HYPH|nr:sulfate transporter family protein [Roseibium aggregatum]MBN9672823.1 sulfate transporter family protein [Roseibium aggregatum]